SLEAAAALVRMPFEGAIDDHLRPALTLLRVCREPLRVTPVERRHLGGAVHRGVFERPEDEVPIGRDGDLLAPLAGPFNDPSWEEEGVRPGGEAAEEAGLHGVALDS